MSKAEAFVIEAARRSHRELWRPTSDTSAGTSRSIDVCRDWQSVVGSGAPGVPPKRFEIEFQIAADANQRIDVVDRVAHTAFELKSSANNPHHEFYKDIFKVMVHNKEPRDCGPIRKLVFLTPWAGARRLRGPFVDSARELASSAGVQVRVEVLDPDVALMSEQIAKNAAQFSSAADRTLDWIVKNAQLRVEYWPAKTRDSLRVFADRADGFPVFKLDTTGMIEILFDSLTSQPKRKFGCSLEQFRVSLNRIPEVEIPEDSILTWKSFPVTAIGSSANRELFSDAVGELLS